MAQRRQRDVFDVDPSDLEHALPLVRRPDVRRHGIVDGSLHLGNAGKVAAAIESLSKPFKATQR